MFTVKFSYEMILKEVIPAVLFMYKYKGNDNYEIIAAVERPQNCGETVF